MLSALIERFKYISFTPAKQQAFLEDLATLIGDGVPAKQAAELLAQESTSPAEDVAQSILNSLGTGKGVADGLHGWFAPHIVELIRAGEESGTLDKSMKAASEASSQTASSISSLFGSMTYPIVVICAGLVIMVFINHSVLASFRSVLPESQWPQVGRDLAFSAALVQNWWWLFLMALTACLLCIVWLLRNYVGDLRKFIDALPGFNQYRRQTSAHLMQTLGLLLSNGLIFKEALKILQYTATPYLMWHLITMEFRLSGGKENIAEVLNTGLLDKMDLARLRVIAYSKGFEHALVRQGEYALNESHHSIKALGRGMGIILLGIGALLAVFMIFGIYTVGFSLSAAAVY